MNEAAREVETRRPGICHHEAAHAVFAYHLGEPIAHVMVGGDSECLFRFRYMREDPASTARVVAGILAGKYAEELAATGKPRQHIPYEEFVKGIEDGWRTNTWPAGTEMDEVQAFVILLMSLGRQKAKDGYREACIFAAEHVELWRDEINAVAKGLLARGHLDGGEVKRIIRSAGGGEERLGMPSTDGSRPKNAVLYARVSTEEQVKRGYSLAQQLEALREYAAHEGYEVLEEVEDPGQSGASLERPGMDRVRNLVAAGSVSVVLAQDRDRFAREPAYLYLLREEFAEHGTRLEALNDRGDDTPEGELTDGVLDQLAKYERAKIAERTRRGKLQKARQGKIIATMKPPYGFRYNSTRDALVIHEPERAVVEKIFRLAAEGHGTKAIQTRLYRAGVSSPTGRELWHRPVLKRMVLSDTYKPHTYQEAMELVPSEVTGILEEGKSYGIRWWNRSSQRSRQVAEATHDGQRHYRRKVAYVLRSPEEWIAVPIPAFLPRELVERARTMMAAPRPQGRKNLARGWELRGVIRCPSCGAAMTSHTAKRGEKLYHYYRCHRSMDYRRSSCNQKMERAHKAEEAMWEFVSGAVKHPERIRIGMDALIEQKRAAMRGEDPERQVRSWLERLAEVGRERRGYLRLAAQGRISDAELDEALADLEGTRKTAERELEAISSCREEIEQLERARDALVASWSATALEELDRLTPQGRNDLYHMLRLEISPTEEGYEITGPFCTSEPLSCSR